MSHSLLSALRWPALALAFLLAVSTSALAQVNQEFCWKDTVTRGAGTMPSTCGAGQDRVGALCYEACPAGFERNPGTVDCVSKCPEGWRNDGLFCRKAEYGRGAGYPWQWGDPLNDSGMYARCQADHGAGRCEPWGAVIYPKCKPGFAPFGCCLCRPEVPNCAALGFAGQVDLSCTKKLVLASTPRTGNCGPGEIYDAGLCYKSCPSGMVGVGPVCWSTPPGNWSECGMGSAKDSGVCASVVVGQISSVGQLAAFIISAGSSGAGTTAASAATKAEKVSKLKKAFDQMKASFDMARKTYPKLDQAVEAGKKGLQIKSEVAELKKYTYDAYDRVSQAADYSQVEPNNITEEDIVRAAAEIASLLDPTGVSAVISAYTYPVCSKYFKPGSGLVWADTSVNQQVPGAPVYGGSAGGAGAYGVCRAEVAASGQTVPGRMAQNQNCFVARPDGVAETISDRSRFDALAAVNNNGAQWLTLANAQSGGKKPEDLVEGGRANNISYGVCRFMDTENNGNRHHLIGRLSAGLGSSCLAAYGNAVKTSSQYDVLVKSYGVAGSAAN